VPAEIRPAPAEIRPAPACLLPLLTCARRPGQCDEVQDGQRFAEPRYRELLPGYWQAEAIDREDPEADPSGARICWDDWGTTPSRVPSPPRV